MTFFSCFFGHKFEQKDHYLLCSKCGKTQNIPCAHKWTMEKEVEIYNSPTDIRPNNIILLNLDQLIKLKAEAAKKDGMPGVLYLSADKAVLHGEAMQILTSAVIQGAKSKELGAFLDLVCQLWPSAKKQFNL